MMIFDNLTEQAETFLNRLKNIFIGTPIEGQGGYVNLYKLKTLYYENLKHIIKNDINKALVLYPDFKTVFLDNLCVFFSTFFDASGSICFNCISNDNDMFHKLYVNNISWFSNMFYYIKTDKIFQSKLVVVNDKKFFFDASTITYKKNNERYMLKYQFNGVKDNNVIEFKVYYVKNINKNDNIKTILKDLESYNIDITEQDLKKSFRLYERQKDIDYYIPKNAHEFLKEQFDIWCYKYFYSKINVEDSDILKKINMFKNIALKIIDYVGHFENNILKLWNMPKAILNVNYVITLDRIIKQNNGFDILSKILNHKNIEQQKKEWISLGFIPEDFNINNILICNTKSLIDNYKFLPLDTKYFKDLETEILSLFENLDSSLDGWLINSENYQALNTLLPKFKEKVQTIYIDPPFNLNSSDQFMYRTNYKAINWAILLENRLRIAKEFLNEKGSIFVRCDYHGNWIVRILMSEIFGEENFKNEIIVNRGAPKAGLFKQFDRLIKLGITYDNLLWVTKKNIKFKIPYKTLDKVTKERWTRFHKNCLFGDRPTMRYELLGVKIEKGQWMWSKERALKAVENYKNYLEEYKKCGITLESYWVKNGKSMEFIRKNKDKIEYWIPPKEKTILDNNWLDIPGYSFNWGFATENSEALLKRVIESTSNQNDIIMDFFLGSGTTTAVAHKLGRKWIGVEMGEHFYTVILPRMKKVLFYDKSGISKQKDVKEIYNNNKAGGFFMYCELEQFEDVLANLQEV